VSTDGLEAALRRPNGPRSAAVVELLTAHDEVMPSLFDTLLANGIEPTGFLNSSLGERGELFGFTATPAGPVPPGDHRGGTTGAR
jgi:hypothetical protein